MQQRTPLLLKEHKDSLEGIEVGDSEPASEPASSSTVPNAPAEVASTVTAPRQRLAFVDTARGAIIALMIFVNHSDSDKPAWLAHAYWNGLHLADFVMPAFLFIVGMSVALSISTLRRKRIPKRELVSKVLTRCAKLVALGLLVQGGVATGRFPAFDLASLRYMGVLQRIALCILIVSLIVVFVPYRKAKNGYAAALQNDETLVTQQPGGTLLAYPLWWLTAFSIFSFYAAVSLLVRVPGCSVRPANTPGCNVASYIDERVLGASHMYPYPTCKHATPPCQELDPEGLFSTIGASVSALIGLYYGMVLVTNSSARSRIVGFLVPSILLGCFGWLLAANGVPLNKNLYSVSYILATAGCTGFMLTAVYMLTDVMQVPAFVVATKPFVWLGMNSIAVYVGDECLEQMLRWVYYESPDRNLGKLVLLLCQRVLPVAYQAQMLYAGLDVMLWCGIAYWLFQRRIVFKV